MLRWLVLPPALILSIWIAIANRHAAIVNLDPFDPDAPALAYETPMYLVLFVTGLIGLVLGGFFMWLAQGRYRRLARQEHQRAEKLKKELGSARAEASAPPTATTIQG